MEDEDKIENILENFDWEKVRKTMECIGWTWHNELTPTTYRMISTARQLLQIVVDDADPLAECHSGGFCARKLGDGRLSLAFEVTGWVSEDR